MNFKTLLKSWYILIFVFCFFVCIGTSFGEVTPAEEMEKIWATPKMGIRGVRGGRGSEYKPSSQAIQFDEKKLPFATN